MKEKHYVICDKYGKARYDFYCNKEDDVLYEAKMLSKKIGEKIIVRKITFVDVAEFEENESEYFYS